jgi:hypothetical protein
LLGWVDGIISLSIILSLSLSLSQNVSSSQGRAAQAAEDAAALRGMLVGDDDANAWWRDQRSLASGGRQVTAEDPLTVLVAGGGLAGLITAAVSHSHHHHYHYRHKWCSLSHLLERKDRVRVDTSHESYSSHCRHHHCRGFSHLLKKESVY